MEEQQGEAESKEGQEGGKRSPLPGVGVGGRPPLTLARMSMVVQVSISCMDTGVCPSALASRISTSCSAFSLNVSIRLTRELGRQHARQRPRGPARGVGGEASVQSGSDGPSRPPGLPVRLGPRAWVPVTKQALGYHIPLHADAAVPLPVPLVPRSSFCRWAPQL